MTHSGGRPEQQCSSLLERTSWLTVSKAVERSKNTPIVCSFLSQAVEILSHNSTSASLGELSGQRENNLGDRERFIYNTVGIPLEISNYAPAKKNCFLPNTSQNQSFFGHL